MHTRTIINPRLKNNSTSFTNFISLLLHISISKSLFPLAQYILINIHNYIHSPPKTYCEIIDSNSKACIFERAFPFRARVSPFLYSMWISPKKERKRKRNVHHSQESGRPRLKNSTSFTNFISLLDISISKSLSPLAQYN